MMKYLVHINLYQIWSYLTLMLIMLFSGFFIIATVNNQQPCNRSQTILPLPLSLAVIFFTINGLIALVIFGLDSLNNCTRFIFDNQLIALHLGYICWLFMQIFLICSALLCIGTLSFCFFTLCPWQPTILAAIWLFYENTILFNYHISWFIYQIQLLSINAISHFSSIILHSILIVPIIFVTICSSTFFYCKHYKFR